MEDAVLTLIGKTALGLDSPGANRACISRRATARVRETVPA